MSITLEQWVAALASGEGKAPRRGALSGYVTSAYDLPVNGPLVFPMAVNQDIAALFAP